MAKYGDLLRKRSYSEGLGGGGSFSSSMANLSEVIMW